MSEGFIPYVAPRVEDPERAGRDFLARMNARRSVRDFSADPVPQEMIEIAVATANTAPSGAHQQPWTFVAVSDPQTKRRIRGGGARQLRGRAPAGCLARCHRAPGHDSG